MKQFTNVYNIPIKVNDRWYDAICQQLNRTFPDSRAAKFRCFSSNKFVPRHWKLMFNYKVPLELYLGKFILKFNFITIK